MQSNKLTILQLIFLISGLVFITSSCKSKEEAPKQDNSDEFAMYEMSEMSLLMEQMYADNQRLKEKIIKGELPEEFPEHFMKIHEAQTTKEGQMDDFFKENAALFLEAQKSIYQHPEKAKEYYNQAIALCVKCHEVKCQGPIPRIEKLYIPTE